MLQESLDHLPLGLRLHRRSSAGAYANPKQGDADFLAKVFLTVFKITAAIDKDAIIGISGYPMQIRYTNSFDPV